MKRLRNWLLFVLIVVIWGSNWIVMKSGLRVTGPLNFVMHRFLFALLALSPALMYSPKMIPRDRDTWRRLLVLSLINSASILSTNIGLVYEKSGISAVLTYTQPLFVFCLAVPFLKEKPSIARLMGVLMGFVGVLVLYLEGVLSSTLLSQPLAFLLLGAFFWAVTIVYYKKALSHVGPVVTNVVQFAVGVIILSTLALMFEGFHFIMTGTYVLIVLYMSVFASAIALTLWVLLLKEEEATVVSASSFVIPMVALVFGWLFLGEVIELQSILGLALILSGVYLVNRKT